MIGDSGKDSCLELAGMTAGRNTEYRSRNTEW